MPKVFRNPSQFANDIQEIDWRIWRTHPPPPKPSTINWISSKTNSPLHFFFSTISTFFLDENCVVVWKKTMMWSYHESLFVEENLVKTSFAHHLPPSPLFFLLGWNPCCCFNCKPLKNHVKAELQNVKKKLRISNLSNQI